MSLAVHARPETKFAEYHAQQVLTGWLIESGFTLSAGVGRLDTAITAVHEGGPPGPYVTVLAEYDALPGVGHGCGHNLIAAGAAAAAIGLVRVLPEHPGTVTVIGTPGQEMGGAGKVRLAEAGVFEGVDAAFMFHPRTVRRPLGTPWPRRICAWPSPAAARTRRSRRGRAAARSPEYRCSSTRSTACGSSVPDAVLVTQRRAGRPACRGAAPPSPG